MPQLADPMPLPHGAAMPNRFMLAPLTNMQSHADGTLSDDEYHWLVARAQGGFGLTMTAAAHVQQVGQGFPGQIGIWSDDHLPGLERLAAGIRAAGSLSSVQLHHAGWRSPTDLIGQQPVGPWADEATGTRAMSTGEVEQLIADFIAAAVRAERAGFDGIELHGAHHYVLCSFLDAERNHRDDRYGGSFENRTRIIYELIDGVRAATGPAFQLGLRLSPERFGITIAESRALAAGAMATGKLDYLDMSLWDVMKLPNEAEHQDKPLIGHFTDLPRHGTQLGVAGKIMSAARAQECLDLGADFVLIGRGAILHHDFPRLALADADFVSTPLPVTRAHLKAEALGPAFIDYMATNWKNFVVA